ncbi:MAG: Molybdenum cofactor guanylyltransferase [Turneriella sp.]|nr:Molybdenum cofactor guanylyltransferase [Turneriella sp.]
MQDFTAPIGVVLCGGLSARMGTDKGLIFSGSHFWAERVALLLQKFCYRIIYSINPRQRISYKKSIPSAEFVEDLPHYQNMGPLGGLLSVHAAFPVSDILLVACDMQDLLPKDIEPLLSPRDAITLYRINGIFEPLCAYYPVEALRKIAGIHASIHERQGLQKILALPELRVRAFFPEDPSRLISRNSIKKSQYTPMENDAK